ncbi:hypothetical protein V6N11_014229 [Hibiscus sabdariffa]|uniref:Peroxidase n=1 Tax=Hibiscus sabdariffa TaxID=183260 RepID=A0ABR1ZTY0_9ROSI
MVAVVSNSLSCLAIGRVAVMVTLLVLSSGCQAQLSSTFYEHTCPHALKTIRTVVRAAIARERRMAASLIRLHFHDCFVQGCDASILLDDSPSIESEKFAKQSNNSLRGYEVIDEAKSAVEKTCPGVVSCADIVAVAARDASKYAGGPSWTVKLGRRDSTTANITLATSQLPRVANSLEELISLFGSKGLSAREMVALSGAHTLGQSRCVAFQARMYGNRSDIDAEFASARRRNCPPLAPDGDGNLAPLDPVTPNSFDNNYFKNLLKKKGLLQPDQVLFNGGRTDNIVLEYSRNRLVFESDFASAMIKLGDIEPLTGSAGIVRKICRRVN